MLPPTCAGKPLIYATISEPVYGCWVAVVEVDSAEELTGAVELAMPDGTAFTGTVLRGGLEAGRWLGRVVGGAGGLGLAVAARGYTLAQLGAALTD